MSTRIAISIYRFLVCSIYRFLVCDVGNAASTVPNFAHMLLGFDVNNLSAQSVTRTDLTLSTQPNSLAGM